MSCYHSPTQPRCWNSPCFYYLYFFSVSSVAALLDDRSGLLSMPAGAHITKLCKDIGKEVDTVLILMHEIWLKPRGRTYTDVFANSISTTSSYCS